MSEKCPVFNSYIEVDKMFNCIPLLFFNILKNMSLLECSVYHSAFSFVFLTNCDLLLILKKKLYRIIVGFYYECTIIKSESDIIDESKFYESQK